VTRYKIGKKTHFEDGPHYLLIRHINTINSTLEISVETWDVLNIDTGEVGEYGFLPHVDKVLA
jgi:hypothetical protein